MDGDAGALSGAFLLAFLLIMNFIMTAFASAAESVTDTELEEAFGTDPVPKVLNDLIDHPSGLKHTIWLLTALSYAGLGFLVMVLSDAVSAWILFPVSVILLYLFGNSIPVMLGRKNALRWVTRRYGTVHVIQTAARPFTWIMTVLSDFCVRMLGIDPKSLESEVTEDEIISMVNEGHEQGVLDAGEAEMIQNIFELDDKNAGDIMTHRKNIIAIDGAQNLDTVIAFMAEQTLSRFPVYLDSIDNVIGILHFKDAMKFHTFGNYDKWLIKDIPDLIRPAKFIPETRGINLLFRSMQASKLQLVLVVDEYGQTAGLVTMEDILEEIVGNIQDEYDNDVELIRRDGDGCFLMDGMTPLPEAEETLGISFEGEEYDTLNGLLIARLDRIPEDGEMAEIREQGWLFQIIEVKNKTIHLVKISKLPEEQSEKEIP